MKSKHLICQEWVKNFKWLKMVKELGTVYDIGGIILNEQVGYTTTYNFNFVYKRCVYLHTSALPYSFNFFYDTY